MVGRSSPAARRKHSKVKARADHRQAVSAPGELVALRGQLERLLELNRQRELSLSQLAHDLRTPLGVIRVAAQRLRIRNSGHDEVSDSIDQQVDELARLIHQRLNPAGTHQEPLPGARDGSAAEPSRPTSAVHASRRILAVDDNRDAVDGLAVMLRLLGHEVHVAYDAAEAIRAAAELRPELVMLDLGLPNVSGYQLARQIRKEAWGGSVRLIAVTGWGSEMDKRRAEEAGFDQHLLKPIDFETLRRILD
jgi:CheY-like chemotaxis protein